MTATQLQDAILSDHQAVLMSQSAASLLEASVDTVARSAQLQPDDIPDHTRDECLVYLLRHFRRDRNKCNGLSD